MSTKFFLLTYVNLVTESVPSSIDKSSQRSCLVSRCRQSGKSIPMSRQMRKQVQIYKKFVLEFLSEETVQIEKKKKCLTEKNIQRDENTVGKIGNRSPNYDQTGDW